MKTNFVRMTKLALVAASALAFMNCGSDPVAAAQDAVSNLSSSSAVSEPVFDPITGQLIDPATGLPVEPASSSSEPVVDPETGLVIDPATGLPVEPASSSSEPVVDPETGLVIDPVTGIPVEPASSADAEPESGASDVVAPVESSSSEAEAPAISSSSEEVIQQAPKGIFLANDTDENKDYMEVEYFTNTGDNGGGVLAYPKRLSDTQKHGVVLWGPGGGEKPGKYEGLIRRLASHGFVVIATSESPDGIDRGKPALDWLENKNNTPGDPLYQKLDMTKVGASGHSMGGLQSEEMLIRDDRVITAVLNNSGDMGHSDATRIPATKTFAIVYGEGGMERPNAEGDYNNPGVKAPGCLIKMSGGQGNECQQGECGWGHGSGPWGGMAATVAWMRWHLGGEEFRKADFVGSTGRYIDGAIIGQQGHWKGQCKNF